MGNLSRIIFKREKLPEIAIIRAGAHLPIRSQSLLDMFDEHQPFQGHWLPYSYVQQNSNEYFTVFNVYGAAPMLELLNALNDGGVKKIIFLGSAFSKHHPVGQQLLVTDAFDRAGLTLLDGVDHVERPSEEIGFQQSFYDSQELEVIRTTICSVPCVVHNIESVTKFIDDPRVDGIEMELSTLFHFGQRFGFEIFPFIYVSDNPEHSLLDTSKTLQDQRLIASNQTSSLVIEFLKFLNQSE